MSVRECVGYLLAVLVLIWHFGTVFEQSQQQVITAVQALDRDAQTLKNRVTEMEKRAVATPPTITPAPITP